MWLKLPGFWEESLELLFQGLWEVWLKLPEFLGGVARATVSGSLGGVARAIWMLTEMD